MSSPLYTLPGRTQTPVTRTEKIAQWLFAHRAQLALAVGLLALTVVLALSIASKRRKLMEGSILQLSAARFQASKGQMKEAVQSIDEVLRTQRITPVAMQAYVLKGELLMQDGKFEEAAKSYAEGYGQSSLPAYKALMLMGQASAVVELRNYPEAIELYSRFLRDYADHYLVPRAYMEVGRLRSAQKQWKEAQEAYERVLTLYPKSPWAAEAQTNLTAVKAYLPSEIVAGADAK
jgi:tetratricopeptide (TPR) repeat protein